jgi:drug/metabolite transporter (DMT)-like permease
MLGATFFYGLAGVYAKQNLKNVPTLTAATGQQLTASLLLLLPSSLNMPEKAPAMPVILAIIALAVFCTALAYLLYFALISSVGPTKTLTVTYLIPLFGATWGVLFLRETVTLGMLAGLVVILSSVFLVNEVRLKQLRPARA